MRIVFMGTPDFSVPILEAIAQEYCVTLVVTQPDKEVGRKRVLTPSPVKVKALELGIEVFQPNSIKTDFSPIIANNPDIIITAAYGQIIPKEILEFPKYKCINVHASLLPKYRGGAPIHKAIINGEKETGVTIMYMAEKMDAGDIIYQERTPILDIDNVGTMFEKLSALGTKMILDILPKVIEGNITPIQQEANEVTFARNISREEEKIDWNKSSREIFNHVRGLNPWPVSYTEIHDTVIKVYQVEYEEKRLSGRNGEVIQMDKRLGIKTSDGIVFLNDIQVSGKKRCQISDFLNGQKMITLGDVFE